MSLQPIPQPWRDAVCAALKSGARPQVSHTAAGRQIWENEFPSAFAYEIESAFIRALSQPDVLGCQVTMDEPPGETWEFFFQFQGQKLYGKILLRKDRSGVVIFSAHRPRISKLRCE